MSEAVQAMKNRFKNNSIRKKLLIPMMIVLAVQATIFVCGILFEGTIDQMNQNSIDILNERVINRKNYIENEMIQRWSNFENIQERFNKKVKQILQEQKKTASEIKSDTQLASAISNATAEDVIFLLRKNYSTGAFLILDSNKKEKNALGTESIYHSGFYVRDLTPSSSTGDNTDLLVERGASATAKELGLTTSANWRFNFDFSSSEELSSYDFYYKPFLKAIEEREYNYQNLGYWSPPFQLSPDDLEVITYTIPLQYEDGTIYGVVGIDVTLDYLRKMLPTNEIDLNQKGVYVIAYYKEPEQKLNTIIFSGSAYKQFFGESKTLSAEESKKYKNVLLFRHPDGKDSIFGSMQSFKLYNDNTPFIQEKWALLGIIDESNLMAFTKNLEATILFCFILSLLIGTAGAVFSGFFFTKPIKSLVKKVKNSNPQKTVQLDKINIFEIDELASAIENLSQNVADASSRMSKIMSMVNLPIGAFEYYFNSNTVYCTDQFFEVWNIEKENPDSSYISKELFESLLARLNENPEETDDSIYQFFDSNSEEKWIRIKKIEDNYKILGVVIDATEETMEKKKIEHERDYDILTNLLNRRAFQFQMNQIFTKKDKIKIGALIMWDLDSLKYINDTYGHDYGDSYIKLAAETLKKFIPYHALVARMSGDEFFVFLYGYDSQEEIRKVINSVRKIMKSTTLSIDKREELKLRASGGIAWYPYDSTDYQQLIKYADFAMYKIKSSVKGEICEFDKKDYERDSILLSGREELNRLIENSAVDYAFQPIVDSKNGHIFAYEALMRPKSKILKSPFDVIRIAQSQSKLYQIEKLTWFQSLKCYEKNRECFGDCKIFINSISNHILTSEDINLFEQRFHPYLSHIVVELTESEQMTSSITQEKEKWLAHWNAGIAIDDFGSGYNNESVLLGISPDYVKIDMEIVRNIDQDKERQQILLGLLTFLKSKNIKVIAEGVETKEEMTVLIRFGIDYLQGYYLGKGELVPQKLNADVVQSILQINENLRKNVSK